MQSFPLKAGPCLALLVAFLYLGQAKSVERTVGRERTCKVTFGLLQSLFGDSDCLPLHSSSALENLALPSGPRSPHLGGSWWQTMGFLRLVSRLGCPTFRWQPNVCSWLASMKEVKGGFSFHRSETAHFLISGLESTPCWPWILRASVLIKGNQLAVLKELLLKPGHPHTFASF